MTQFARLATCFALVAAVSPAALANTEIGMEGSDLSLLEQKATVDEGSPVAGPAAAVSGSPVVEFFRGQGTPIDAPQDMSAATCWQYRLYMERDSVIGIPVYEGWHDLQWCASGGQVTNVLLGANASPNNGCRGSGNIPWGFEDCGSNSGHPLPRSSTTITGSWSYCYNTIRR